jgi:hypothetical protein
LSEIRDRDTFSQITKKTRKQRQIEEQAQLKEPKRTQRVIESAVEEETEQTTDNLPRVEVFNYEELLDDYGF